MSAANFNLRGIPVEIMNQLKREAKKLHTSVNALILRMIEKGLGISGEKIKTIYHDLDHLAGTWNSAEAKNFKESTKWFEQIDKDIWS